MVYAATSHAALRRRKVFLREVPSSHPARPTGTLPRKPIRSEFHHLFFCRWPHKLLRNLPEEHSMQRAQSNSHLQPNKTLKVLLFLFIFLLFGFLVL